MSVHVALGRRSIPTYPLGAPEKNPLFFEKRVYQGSCGKVYPVPFIDKVLDEPVARDWQSAVLENDFVRLEMLPENGGRIFLGQDKTNRDYDFFYRQDVIKPALVGLAGPWISGGVEFNWPQHHRPGTYLPTDVSIEESADGSKTVWMSEHDALNRLKGMHGIRLVPGSSRVELRARLFNRTPMTQTFLWWANVAARVHDQYESFFPPDVHYVADHAVRALSSFPEAHNPYYGVPYHERPGENDLAWYRNIPVPTSYMVCQTEHAFFGGYDHAAGGGFVHVANRHVSPGKKQWTWGNHEFGWAWDRELTDEGGPYVELMAGVYTDNQPDFSYLLPYETRTFSQFWWPIQGIGPVQAANEIAALRMVVREDRGLELGVCVSETVEGALLRVARGGETVLAETISLKPGGHWKHEALRFEGEHESELTVELRDAEGGLMLAYQAPHRESLTRDRQQATEPPMPEELASSDELFLVGEHLEQYRHPTRDPELYWYEALKRDPEDSRCRLALGKAALRRGEFEVARGHLERSVGRLTHRHPNPVTGEAHYFLGVTLRWLGERDAGDAALYKATWNYEWRAAGYYQLATVDCHRSDWKRALEHLECSLDTNRQNTKALVLKSLVLRALGRTDEAQSELVALREVDRLDHWAGWVMVLLGGDRDQFLRVTRNDAQTMIDLALDFCEAGFFREAADLLACHLENEVAAVAVPNPLERSQSVGYLLGWLKTQLGDSDATVRMDAARAQSADHFFPSRLEEMGVLDWAMRQVKDDDPVAAYGLGNLLYDKKRHLDAIAAWEVAEDSSIPQVARNLGIARWNVHRDGEAARRSYQRALDLDPADARLVAEYDQLCEKLGDRLEARLEFLESRRDLVAQRDDATVALVKIYNLLGRPAEALELVCARRFHPWEGGEGRVLGEYTTAHLQLGRMALEAGDAGTALDHFTKAMETPESLGEAYHLLQAKADVNYWTGKSLRALGREDEAVRHFEMSAAESGDFAEMAVAEHSPLSYYRGLSLGELGRTANATTLFEDLKAFALGNIGSPATIDYFATSLPNLLVFDEDLQGRRDAENHLLVALACHGLGECAESRAHLERSPVADHQSEFLRHTMS